MENHAADHDENGQFSWKSSRESKEATGKNARIVHVNGSDCLPVNAARVVLQQLLNEEAVQQERAIDRACRVAPPACLNEA